jgi:hypothetical protein
MTSPGGGCYELQRILLLLNQLRPKFVNLGFSHAPSESEGEKLMWLQANRGILPHSDLKPENAEQRFHPIKSRVSIFQFVTPSGGTTEIVRSKQRHDENFAPFARSKAAVNAPQSRRVAQFEDVQQSRSVWIARVFSTAFRRGRVCWVFDVFPRHRGFGLDPSMPCS